jgi:hypothetical protein
MVRRVDVYAIGNRSGRTRASGRDLRARKLPVAVMLFVGMLATGALGAGASDAAGPVALASRTVSLNESGNLRLTSHQGFTLNEQGSASGTIRGTIYIHLNVSSTNKVTAEVNIYPHNGSLTGHGSASYSVAGSYASFSGTLSISRGSGSYSHAHASRLRFTGTIQRRTDAVTVRLSGPLSY